MSTTQPERPTCATCPYYQTVTGEEGDCRRFPPNVVRIDLDNGLASLPPAVECDSWCGEHPDFPAWIAATRALKT